MPKTAPRLIAGVAGLATLALLVGPAYLFIEKTRPYKTHVEAPAHVRLSDADLKTAETFPTYRDAIPVLTFHDVATNHPGDYTVSPQQFGADLAALRAAGFHSVSLQDVSRFMSGDTAHLPSRPVLLAFDDGPVTNWTVADRVMAEHGFRGVAFLITGRMADHEPSYYLTWAQARAMRDTGRWEFGSHTESSHGYVDLPDGGSGPALINRAILPDGSGETFEQWQARAARDLDVSARAIERELGTQPVAFAFPFGAAEVPSNDSRIPGALADMVKARYPLGFRGTLTNPVIGPASSRQSLSRITISPKMSPADLLAQLKDDIPFPPPGDVSTQPWHSGTDGSCDASAGAVTLRTAAFNRCDLAGNSTQWDDYRLTTTVRGSGRAATAVVVVRSSLNGRVEVAMGESTAKVRQQVGKDPYVALGEIALERPPADGRTITVTAQGDRLTVAVDSVAPAVFSTDPALRVGFAGFALAATGDQTVTFDRPTVTSLSIERASAPPTQIGSK